MSYAREGVHKAKILELERKLTDREKTIKGYKDAKTEWLLKMLNFKSEIRKLKISRAILAEDNDKNLKENIHLKNQVDYKFRNYRVLLNGKWLKIFKKSKKKCKKR